MRDALERFRPGLLGSPSEHGDGIAEFAVEAEVFAPTSVRSLRVDNEVSPMPFAAAFARPSLRKERGNYLGRVVGEPALKFIAIRNRATRGGFDTGWQYGRCFGIIEVLQVAVFEMRRFGSRRAAFSFVGRSRPRRVCHGALLSPPAAGIGRTARNSFTASASTTSSPRQR